LPRLGAYTFPTMARLRDAPRFPTQALILFATVFALVLCATILSNALSSPSISIFAFRPQLGIVACALIIHPRRYSALVLVASFLGMLLPGAPGSIIPAPFMAAISLVEASFFAWAMLRSCKRIELCNIVHVLLLVVMSSLSTISVAALVSLVLSLAGKVAFLGYAQLWSMSDAFSLILIVPFFLGLSEELRKPRPIDRVRKLEALLLFVASASLGSLWFLSMPLDVVYTFFVLTIPLPFLIWAGARFGTFGTSLASLFLFGCAVVGTILGRGTISSITGNIADRITLAHSYAMWFSLLPLFNASSIERRKRIESELMAANAELEEAKGRADASRAEAVRALEAKGIFLSNMSHEIRTPLTGMLGMVTLLAKTSLDERQALYVDRLKAAGKNLLGIVSDILDVEKLESVKPKLEPTDLEALCRSVLSNYEAAAAAKGLSLSSSFEGLDARLVTDPSLLSRVLWNLVGNAVKFTERGEVRLSASAAAEGPSSVALRIRVEDTGIGMAASDLVHIFDRFYQIDSSYSKKYEGTGLGLHIAKRAVESLGGSIEVESAQGKGSAFTVELSCALTGAVPAGAGEGKA
jgi:signal transduction histidine kinase